MTSKPEFREGLIVLQHKFAVGQTVELTPSTLRAAAAGEYEIRRLMPASDVKSDSPRYRIKSIAENHERVAPESDLMLSMELFQKIRQPADGVSLPKIEP